MTRIKLRTRLAYCPSCLIAYTLHDRDYFTEDVHCKTSGCTNYLGSLTMLVQDGRLASGLLAEIYLGAV